MKIRIFVSTFLSVLLLAALAANVHATEVKLTASDGAADDWFGRSVAISGDYAVVGAPYDDDAGSDSGSAYIFKRDGTAWNEQAKITASDDAAYDWFGYSVAISGDYAVVCARGDDDAGSMSGSAYIFKRDGTAWIEQAKITASDGFAGDWFGASVAISGDYAVVGAYADDDAGSMSGSAYIFKRDGTAWIEQAKITASDGAAEDLFGGSVAISGDYAVAGAPGDDDAGLYSGSAYIYTICAPPALTTITVDPATLSIAVGGTQTFTATTLDQYGDPIVAVVTWNSSNTTVGTIGETTGVFTAVAAGTTIVTATSGSVSGIAAVSAAVDYDSVEVKITASDGAADDLFGYSVAISGDCAVVGARGDDDADLGSGSAYIFKYNGTAWTEQAKITASDGAALDNFGCSVAISGDYAVVGAYYDYDVGPRSGSAYIFKRDGTAWTEQAKITASDGAAGDFFGYSVAISGDYAVVGALMDDDAGYASGSAYIFKRDGTAWTEQAKITASDGAAHDYFGVSVAISGDLAVVGAYWDDDAGSMSGSAYIFKRDGTTWTEQAKITASDGAAIDCFGYSVAISGDYAVVGAHYDDAGSVSGSAYIFKYNGTTWTEQAKINASDGAADDYFGVSVAISGDYAVVGAIMDDDAGYASGSAYIFKRDGTTWTEHANIYASDGAAEDRFGRSVAISGDYAVVGAIGDDDAGWDSGSAYIYTICAPPALTTITVDPATLSIVVGGTQTFTATTRDQYGGPIDAVVTWNSSNTTVGTIGETTGVFTAVAAGTTIVTATSDSVSGTAAVSAAVDYDSAEVKITASDGAAYDFFGVSVAISGDYAVVGARYDDDAGRGSGSAYIFKRDGTAWNEQAKITASDGAVDDYFGKSVAISGDYAVVGAYGDDDAGESSGSAYIFKRDGTTWTEQAKINASDGAADDHFGVSVAISGDYAVVGARYDDDAGSMSGSAYIFKRDGTAWTEQAKITASDGAAGDYFGGSVAISGDCAVVGAIGDDDASCSGSAYIFKRNGTEWTEQAKITASDGAAGDFFGESIAISCDLAVVGAYCDDDAGTWSGSAYIFEYNGTAWNEQAKITASDGAAWDFFGISVAISGGYAIVGAYWDDDAGENSGSAYIFKRNGTAWTQEAKINASDGAEGDHFGVSVAISGDYAVVGAHGDDDAGLDSGSAYIYDIPIGIFSCDSNGNPRDQFAPGETVYVTGTNLTASTSYKLWIQDEAVSDGDTLVAGEDPSGAQESVDTYPNGTLPVTAIWAIDPGAAVTRTEYDIVADNQAAGVVGTYNASSDLLDSANVAGFVAPVPEQYVFTTADAVIALQIAVGNRPPDLRWDVSGDGQITSLDALMILQAVAGKSEGGS